MIANKFKLLGFALIFALFIMTFCYLNNNWLVIKTVQMQLQFTKDDKERLHIIRKNIANFNRINNYGQGKLIYDLGNAISMNPETTIVTIPLNTFNMILYITSNSVDLSIDKLNGAGIISSSPTFEEIIEMYSRNLTAVP